VNAESLPYAVLILLAELAVGSLAVMTAFDARGQVTSGYIKAGALTIVPLAGLAAWTGLSLPSTDAVDGYAISDSWLAATRALLVVFTGVTVAHAVASMSGRRRERVLLGAAGAIAGTIALAALAALVATPVWSYAGMLVSVLAATVVLGAALMSMIWGHWYLTSGRLPKEPLEQMALLVVAALAVQAALVALAVAVPAREVPLAESAFGVGLGQNPAFWLRVGVGLAFPLAVAFLAWRAARIRGMMSATGLLYIALGAVLAGEVLARGLLFSTGSPV
jgi:magnesium-transporting ATPase (P-type)